MSTAKQCMRACYCIMPMRSGIGRCQINSPIICSEDGFAKFKPRQIFPLYGIFNKGFNPHHSMIRP